MLRVLKRLGLMMLGIVVFTAVLVGLQWLLQKFHTPAVIVAIITLVLALVVYWGYERYTERRIPAEVAPKRMLRLTILGLLFGLVIFSITIGVIALAGDYRIIGSAWSTALLVAFVALLADAAAEEIIFRGFIFRTCRDLWGPWIALAISAVLFGAIHAFNPHATVVSSVAIAIEAGVLLAVAYAVTESLWFPIGIHAGWNFSESMIYGTNVSGIVVHDTLFSSRLAGPDVLTGGSFGPEASIVAVAVCLVASLALGWSRRRIA
ncbi:MAG TPA: type II CAAX endopeptidase family protein [Candidatus Baltobacteraceae bacterium]